MGVIELNLLSYVYLIGALLVLLLIIYNQLRIRQVRRDLRLRLPVILTRAQSLFMNSQV